MEGLEAYKDLTLAQIAKFEEAGNEVPEALLRNLGEITLLEAKHVGDTGFDSGLATAA